MKYERCSFIGKITWRKNINIFPMLTLNLILFPMKLISHGPQSMSRFFHCKFFCFFFLRLPKYELNTIKNECQKITPKWVFISTILWIYKNCTEQFKRRKEILCTSILIELLIGYTQRRKVNSRECDNEIFLLCSNVVHSCGRNTLSNLLNI